MTFVLKACRILGLLFLFVPGHALVVEMHNLTQNLQRLEQQLTQKAPLLSKNQDLTILNEQKKQEEDFESINLILTDFVNFGGPALLNTLFKNIEATLNELHQASLPIQHAYKQAIYEALNNAKDNMNQENIVLVQQQKNLLDTLIKATQVETEPQLPIRLKPWLSLPNNLTISNATNNYIIGNPPFKLKDENEIIQLTVLSQFLRVDDVKNPQKYQLETGIKMQPYIQLLKTVPGNNTIFNKFAHTTESDFLLLGGGPASCGYHAVKNALLILRLLHAQNENNRQENLRLMLDIDYATKKFAINTEYADILGEFKNGEWREYAIDTWKDLKNDMGDWIGQDIIKPLFKHVLEQEPEVWKENIKVALNDEIGFIKELQKEKNAIYVFFVLEIAGERGHWYTVIINVRDGKHQYIIADSANAPRYPQNLLNQQGIQAKIPIKSFNTIIKALE